jgi:hypothetical protein
MRTQNFFFKIFGVLLFPSAPSALKQNALIAVGLFVALGLLTWRVGARQMPPTGDEPHYLMTAHSLAVDGDISLLNNYRERQYRIFYPGLLAKRTTANFDKTRELPAFGLGLSAFLAPFYWFALTYFPSQLVLFLRIMVCSITSIAAYQTLSLGAKLTGRVAPPAVVFLGAVFASPLITYCNQFYPEIFALLLVVLALRLFESLPDRPWLSALGLACIAPAILWLHPKYLVLSVLIYLLSAFRFVRAARQPGGSVLRLVPAIHSLLSIGGILSFFVFLHAEYGSWSPNRIYGGWQKQTTLIELIGQLGFERIWVMLRMLPGYWLDQRFGLIPYAPLYIAFFPALIGFIRNGSSRIKLPLLVLLIAHFGLLCWAAQMGGYAPPSRHLVVLIPLILLPIMALYPQWSRAQKLLFTALQFAGWIVSAAILTHYRLIFTNATWRNPDGFSEFWSWFHLERSLPLLTATSINFVPVALWMALVALLATVLYPKSSAAAPGQPHPQ